MQRYIDTQAAASFVILISRHCHIKWHASEAKLCEGYGRYIYIYHSRYPQDTRHIFVYAYFIPEVKNKTE